jgi:hypothetical protein
MRGLVAAVLAGLLASGCGGSPEPGQLPAPERSSTPSASAKPAPPVMPKAAKAKTRAGAIAFARLFMATLNYAGGNGETQPLRRLFIGECTRCEAIADGIEQTYRQGGYFLGGEWSPTRFKLYSIQNDVAVLDAFVTYEAQTWVKKSGAKPIRYGQSRNNLKAFNLRWQGGAWHVSALDPTA